ncbi:F0F1 ATP synthase subunit B family protein [Thermovibrio ammonificans]|jgi:F-type H+-transporting ATPase subunit b|uniref:ATP synthase subunit b n=1 Tax=Thermovibrio ammonificans (strain DSM 15698 / JCM 12110 / HB-1) TaxID=648996 RepID=E8T5F9_THEA1|nr:ATP synthase F0 subunit B [Thermovibrio ammonificans]ADU97613.1 ATP synthase F0, B subunit [Thermovibrio ammonificans HB-1]
MEGGGHLLFWKFVNTIILFALLYWILRKPVSNFISNGIEAITTKFEKAKQEKEEALKLLKEAEKKSQEAKAEAERIIAYSKEVAQREKEQIIAEAKQTAERIVKMADEEIEKELYKAKEELKKFAAQKAVELAENKLKGSITPEVNKKLIESSLEKL